MKIRSGFVSNSSSSSFLIKYNKNDTTWKDFARFKLFDGYLTFIKDFNNAEAFDEKVQYFIFGRIMEYFYQFSHNLTKFCNVSYNSLLSFYDIFSEIDREELSINKVINEKIKEIRNEIEVFWKKLDEANHKLYDYLYSLIYVDDLDFNEVIVYQTNLDDPDRKLWNNLYNEYLEKVYELTHNKEFEKDLINSIKELMEDMKENGFVLKELSYEDHDDEGNLMEHYFMPFLAMDPGQKIQVFIANCH